MLKSVIVTCCLLKCALFSFLSADETCPSSKVCQVAVMLDLSGSQKSLGQQALNGFLLAIQRASPEVMKNISIRIINTQSDQGLTKKLAEDIVPSISFAAGFTDTGSVLASGKVFEKYQVPFLSIGATDSTLSQKFSGDIFLTPFGDDVQAQAAAEYAKSTFGNTCVLIEDSTSWYTKTLKNYFQNSYEKLGGKILLTKSFRGGCSIKEIGKQIHDLKEQPSFIYLAGLPDCIKEVIQSLREENVLLPIIGGDGLDSLELNTKGISNVWFTAHAWLSDTNRSPQVVSFLKAYKSVYEISSMNSFAALGFDAANLMIHAITHASSYEPEAIKKSLESITKFPGVTGSISFTKEDHTPHKPVWIIQIQDGEPSLVKKWGTD